MKEFRRYIGPASVTLVAFGVALLYKPAPVIREVAATEEKPEVFKLALPHGRVLYVVIDFDGVYLGADRIDFAQARHVVTSLLREEKIPNLIIYGTDRARYGDVVELYAGIAPGLLRYNSFSFQALPTGARRPTTGLLKPQCCHSIDIENAASPES